MAKKVSERALSVEGILENMALHAHSGDLRIRRGVLYSKDRRVSGPIPVTDPKLLKDFVTVFNSFRPDFTAAQEEAHNLKWSKAIRDIVRDVDKQGSAKRPAATYRFDNLETKQDCLNQRFNILNRAKTHEGRILVSLRDRTGRESLGAKLVRSSRDQIAVQFAYDPDETYVYALGRGKDGQWTFRSIDDISTVLLYVRFM